MAQLSENARELTKMLAAECCTTQDVTTLLKSLFAGTIEEMLEAEMAEHLGYLKHSVEGNNTGNSRNGYNKKTIKSEWGESEISVPRDRNGAFEPKVVGETPNPDRRDRTQNIGDVRQRDVGARHRRPTARHIRREVSPGLISGITDKILPQVTEWQNRPLDELYPVVFFDGVWFKMRKDGKVVKPCVYSVLGINMEGKKEILGIWNST